MIHSRSLLGAIFLVLGSVLGSVACRKTAGSSRASTGSESEPDIAIVPMEGREAAQWSAAVEGDPEELMRLEDLVGCEGLLERSTETNLRTTAIRATQYCPDFSELPWLADIAAGKSESEALAALESVGGLAARRRRSTDPEDADELHAGCGALLSLARSTSRSRERRVLAVRALRMLSERGCVRREDLPADVDVK